MDDQHFEYIFNKIFSKAFGTEENDITELYWWYNWTVLIDSDWTNGEIQNKMCYKWCHHFSVYTKFIVYFNTKNSNRNWFINNAIIKNTVAQHSKCSRRNVTVLYAILLMLANITVSTQHISLFPYFIITFSSFDSIIEQMRSKFNCL